MEQIKQNKQWLNTWHITMFIHKMYFHMQPIFDDECYTSYFCITNTIQ